MEVSHVGSRKESLAQVSRGRLGYTAYRPGDLTLDACRGERVCRRRYSISWAWGIIREDPTIPTVIMGTRSMDILAAGHSAPTVTTTTTIGDNTGHD